MYLFVWGVRWDLVTMVHYLGAGLYGAFHSFTFIHVLQSGSPLRCSVFQLYFMIFSTVSSFSCFIAILAPSAQSGFVDTHAAILLYFELVRLISSC